MMNAILAYNGVFADNAKEAGIVTLLGMVAIFSVLAILWGVIELLHQGVNLPAKRKAKKTPSDPTLTDSGASAVEELNESDDGAIVAAIVAAITAARTEAGETAGFRVVSFRRTAR